MSSVEQRLAKLENELLELRDRESIREGIHRYCQAVDRCDLEMLKSCYWPDGYDDHGFFGGNAHAFADYVIPCLERIDSSMHAITNTRFLFQDNRCACTSQWHVTHRLRHDTGLTDFLHQGRYLDVWEKRDDAWKILHRVIVSDLDRWVETVDIRGALDGPNSTLAGVRGADDPGNWWFNLLNHRPERPPLEDLWAPFHALAEFTRNANA